MIMLTGLCLLALGLFSGAVLALSPLGWLPVQAGWMLWVAFPLFSLLGYVLCAVAAKLPVIRGITRTTASLLLVLTLFSAVVLVLLAADVLNAPGSTAPLWYVMAVGGLLGVGGMLPRRETV